MPPSPPLPPPPPPSNLVRRVHGRPRRQKLLHHRRMTFDRSVMQRRPSILRCAAALRQATPLSSPARAPPPAPAILCTTPPQGQLRQRNRRTRPAKRWCHKESRTFRILKEVPILPQYVCGPGCISPQMHPFQQPSDVNFTRSISKGEYQNVVRSWRHGEVQIGIAFYELGG